MSKSDLPSDKPIKRGATKPAAISAVHDERNKRKAAVAKLAQAELDNAVLQERLGNEQLRIRALTLKLQAAEAKAAKYDEMVRRERAPDTLAELGLRFDQGSGTLSGMPVAPKGLYEGLFPKSS